MTAADIERLIAEYEAELAALPEPGEYRLGGGIETQIERTRLLGTRTAIVRLLAAQRAALEIIRQREGTAT